MFTFVEKSGTGIGKSGTGIEKSGTGIEKSGTGIEKSGTGARPGRWQMLIVAAFALFTGQALAAQPQVLVTHGEEEVFVSVHSGEAILVGRVATQDESGYYRLALYSAVGPAGSGAVLEPQVVGSGSGSSGDASGDNCLGGASAMVVGSGSGGSGDACSSGSELKVVGSGSGGSGDSCDSSEAGLMVVGSGSGDSGEACGGRKLVVGSGSGDSGEACTGGAWLEVVGSGSGSSGDSAGCTVPAHVWGIAEVVLDAGGAHVVVHRILGSRVEEFLVAFLPGSSSEVAHSLHGGSSNRAFVAAP